MFKYILFVAILAISCIAQEPRTISMVKGSIASEEPLAGNRMSVNLVESGTHKTVARAYVANDGSFEFRDVSAGSYTVELVAQSGNTIRQETVNLNSSTDQIEMRMLSRENKPGPAATVSVHELKHPLSSKSKRMFSNAQKASSTGDYLKAVEILRGALNDPSAVPYARMNIGVAYLRGGQVALAVPELQEAANLVPEDALVRTNLAYALLMNGRVARSIREVGLFL